MLMLWKRTLPTVHVVKAGTGKVRMFNQVLAALDCCCHVRFLFCCPRHKSGLLSGVAFSRLFAIASLRVESLSTHVDIRCDE